MRLTGQERTALGVVAALLVAGGAYRAVSGLGADEATDAVPAAEAAAPAAAQTLLDDTRRATAEKAEAGRALRPGERIDVNTASEAKLQRLPGVGPALAKTIVEHRPYRTLAELDAVPGVGPSTLADLAPHVQLPDGPAPAVPNRGAAKIGRATALESTVDVNRATAAELQALPGVGPALAARIVEDRERAGPFRTMADLDRVSGIGPATLEGLQGRVRFGP